MNGPTHDTDAEIEHTTTALRQVLLHEADVPGGMPARLQAAVARSRRMTSLRLPSRIVIGALVFTAASFGRGLPMVLSAVALAAMYSMLFDRALDPTDASTV